MIKKFKQLAAKIYSNFRKTFNKSIIVKTLKLMIKIINKNKNKLIDCN